MFWIPEGTLSSKMIENISKANFHTLPYHKMTLLGLWRANLGPKLTPKRSNLTWFCNNLQFFTYVLYQSYKHIEISLFTSNQTPMVISGCFMAVSMSKMDPKRPKFDIICTKIQSFYTICLSVPETHLHVFFTLNEVPMVIFRHFVILPEYIILTFGSISYFRLDCHELVWRFFKAAL